MEWFDKESGVVDGEDKTNGDFIRAFIENLWKAVVELLNKLGEWPIDF